MKTIFLFIALLAINCSFAQQKINYQKKGAPLPKFMIEKTAGGKITNQQMKPGKPVMIMIFSPQCEHCVYVVDSLKTIRDQFKNTQLIVVAEDRNKEFMGGFIKVTNIGSDPLFKNLGTNKGELIWAIYTNKMLPQITFYDSRHKLVKIFDGNYSFADVKKLVE